MGGQGRTFYLTMGYNDYGSVQPGDASSLLEGSNKPSTSGGIAMNERTMLCVASDNKVLFTLALLCFVDSMFSMCLIAFIPELMADEYPLSVALIFSLYSVSVFVGNIACRYVGQTMGRRLMVLVGICG